MRLYLEKSVALCFMNTVIKTSWSFDSDMIRVDGIQYKEKVKYLFLRVKIVIFHGVNGKYIYIGELKWLLYPGRTID